MHTRVLPGPSGHGKHQNPTGFGKKQGHYPTGFGWQNPSGPSVDQSLQKYWSFITKHKVFMLTLSHDGGSVRICERTRLFGYEVAVTIDAVDWFIDILEELLQKTGTQRAYLKRSFRNSTICCFLECFANTKGSFLKISVLRNNKLKMIIVPEEEKKGWSELKECLKGIVKRKRTRLIERSYQTKVGQKAGGVSTHRSWANVVKQGLRPVMKVQHNRVNTQVTVANRDRGSIEWKDLYPEVNLGFKPKNLYPVKRFTQPKFYEYMRSKALPRDWSLAIVLTRNNTHADWVTISYNLSRELERKLVVSQLFDDRCILWGKDEKDRKELLKIHSMKVPGAQSLVTFSAWSLANQMDNVKVECRGSWIGVHGLPLNLWNMKIFRKIGERCGGLLDVDKDTAEASMLSHLRLQLQGDEFGFIPETIIMSQDNTSFELKFFKLNDLSYRFHGSFNTCWYQDFDHGKVFGDGVETEGLEDEDAKEKEGGEEQSRESTTVGGPVSLPEKTVHSGTQEVAGEVVQPRALRPKVALLSLAAGEAAENEYGHFSIKSREDMALSSCVREQGMVVSLHTVYNRLLRSLRGPRICRNPSLNVFLNSRTSCQIGDYCRFKMGLSELGRGVRVPEKVGLHINGPVKHYPTYGGVSGWEFIPGNGPALHIKLREFGFYCRGLFNITLDQNVGFQDLFIKRAKNSVMSDFIGPRREQNVVAKRMSPEQIIQEFFHGRLRSINPKARENFTKAIIQFWKDFDVLKRNVTESVLHYKGEMESEKEGRPKVVRVYCRKIKAFGHDCVSHFNEEIYSSEFEEADEDPKEFEFRELSSDDEESEGEGDVSMTEEGEEADDIICNINELWRVEAEPFSRQELGEVKLDDVADIRKETLVEEEVGVAVKIMNEATSWSNIVDSMAEMGMKITQEKEDNDQKIEEVKKARKKCRELNKLGDKGKRAAIKATICKANPDLVILQEVKRATVDRRFIGSIWRSRFKAWILLPALGRSGGTLLIWDTRTISVLDSLVGEFSISVLINAEGKEPWWFSGVYGPCSYKLRPEFWDELAGLSSICGESWCVGGDFNVTRRVGEKLNSSSCTRSMKLFDGLIRELQLIDPKLENGSFTWSNFRASPVCSRLDRFLFSNNWNVIYPFVRQEMLVRLVSDHSPVVIDSNPPKWGPGPFRFDNHWLEHKSFSKCFESWWKEEINDGWPGTKFMKKLKLLQGKVKEWSKSTFGQNKATKIALEGRLGVLDRLEGTSSWNQSVLDERRKLKEEWQQLHFEEERGIWLKSKCKWAREGDANSRLFHNLLNARKAKNTISRIERDNGDIIDNEKEIVEELIAFFSKLYTSEARSGTGIEGIEWHKIEESSARQLECPFEEEEVRNIVFSCEGNKAPGPDGFSLAALQNNWETIKYDLMEVFRAFHREGRIEGSINDTFICLIPKRLNSCKVKDYRPISLITSVYKIIAKTLATRLRGVLGETISETQSAFVEGRQILDSVLMANEAVEDYRSRGKKGIVLKIDFEKAYDRVDWGFLDLVMRKKGFGERWTKWIRGCVSTTSFSIFINGRVRGKFNGSRGLRQVDPLSPFLFTLIADVLGRMVDKAIDTESLSGFQIGKDDIQLSHLQFADDTLFFVKDEASLQKLVKIVEAFCGISGLKVNLNKSQLLGVCMDEDAVAQSAIQIGCEVGRWPMTYLGMPLGGSPRKRSFWEPVLDKCATRMDGWKCSFLSRGGRLTLIQSVLSSLPIYFLSLFKAPKVVLKELEKMMRDFFWEGGDLAGGDHLVAWDEVCKPRAEGGLAIGRLEMRNKGLLMKWLWRFPLESNSLWHKVIKSRYGRADNFWDTKHGVRLSPRGPWKDISDLYDEYGKLVKFKVGNGACIRFWEDEWIGGSSLRDQFLNLAVISRAKNASIQEMIGDEGEVGDCVASWDLNFRRNIMDREIPSLSQLLQKLEHVRVLNILDDSRIWLPDSCGIFSSKSAFRWFTSNENPEELFWTKILWKSRGPSKVKVFGWLVALDKLNLHARLQKKRPFLCISPGWCVCCKISGEDNAHLFLRCRLASSLWIIR
uniref:Reverse transcriptase domain-containing protein n=1 Tax=Cannabis sativa TaxID=3483 RepID=A0A803QQM3_CANSA